MAVGLLFESVMIYMLMMASMILMYDLNLDETNILPTLLPCFWSKSLSGLSLRPAKNINVVIQ